VQYRIDRHGGVASEDVGAQGGTQTTETEDLL